MKIHFICSGNIFRSRLAEAYLKSKNIPGIEVSSSGINTYLNQGKKISPFAMEIFNENNLLEYSKETYTQTTNEVLGKNDYIIFLNEKLYKKARQLFNKLNEKDAIVWNTLDLDEYNNRNETTDIQNALLTYEIIVKNIDRFLEKHTNELKKIFTYPVTWKDLIKMKPAISEIKYDVRTIPEEIKYRIILLFTSKEKFKKNLFDKMNGEDTILLINDFPFRKLLQYLPNVKQYVLWSKRKLSENEINNELKEIFPKNQYIFLEAKYKSIPYIHHYQVFTLEKNN